MTNWGPAIVVMIGVGVLHGALCLYITALFDDLRNTMDNRFDDLHDLLKSEVKRLEERIDHTRA